MAEEQRQAPLISSSRSNMKEAVLAQYWNSGFESRRAEYIVIWGPSSVERARGKLVGSRVVDVETFPHAVVAIRDGSNFRFMDARDEYIREAMQVAEDDDAGAVDAHVVDLFVKFVKYYRWELKPSILITALARLLSITATSTTHEDRYILNDADLEDVSAAQVKADELGITSAMAQAMVARVLPALDACHLLALTQAQDLLLSSPLLEELHWSNWSFFDELGLTPSTHTVAAWGKFLHSALSSKSTHTLRTLHMSDHLDKGTFRELCSALSESNLCADLNLQRLVLDEEEEEMLSRVLVSPGCNLENLEFGSCRDEEMKSLRAALVHPNCKIWGLTVDEFVTRKQALAFGDHVLRDEKNQLLMLAIKGDTVYFPWEAMGSPACKVEALIYIPYPSTVEYERHVATMLQAASSKIYYLQTGNLRSTDIVEALQRSKFTHFSLVPLVDIRILESAASIGALANFLGSAHCQLESFLCDLDLPPREAELLMHALEMNYQSRLKTLKIRGVDQLRCEHIVKRNALFLASTDQSPFVAATSAKLFICGHSGAGKTTIARNFNRRCRVPASLQRHSTTQGIAMGVLDYNGKHAVICDVAGQEQFHAFHHYFVKGSEKNLFLVVCKVLTDGGDMNSNMQEQMSGSVKYWLRFISSHKALASRRKPKVLIVLNYHGNGGFSKTWVDPINELAEQYTGLLDIVKDEEADNNMCFQVVALQVGSLKRVKDALGVALADVLANHPPVPSLCKKVRDSVKLDKMKTGAWCRCMQYKPRQQRVVTSIEELTETILPGNDDNNAERTSAVKFTMACMHDMGESLYFGVDYENDEVLANSATLDMQWFVQELVGIFIQVSRDDDWRWRRTGYEQRQIQRQQDEYKVSMVNIVPKIEKMCSPNQLVYVLTALHKIGVLLPSDDNWNGTWSSNHPKQVIVPALLQNEFSDTGWGSDEYIYWGRRMACKDRVCTLLPSGIFNVIQVSLKQLCKNPSFKLGKGWVCFEENKVCVVVRVGGDTNHWVDRQWVDIMVMTKKESKACLIAEDMVNRIKNCVAKECESSLEIVEYVLNPEHIKATVTVQHNTNEFAETMAVTLEQIYKEAMEEGFEYSHTWDLHKSNEVSELLMLGELQGYVKDWERSITDDYNESTASVYNITEVEPWGDFFVMQNNPASPAIDPDLWKVLMHMIHRLDNIDQRFDNIDQQLVGIAAGINDLKVIARRTQQAMELYGQKVLAQCSKMLDKLNISCPRYPYFTDMNNKIANLVGARQVKLRYCCESSTKGIHQVDGCDGLVLELAPDWFSNHSHIIVPALTGIYFTLKIAGKALGAGDLFDFALDFFKGKVTDTLKSVLTPELYYSENRKQQPTESDINEIFARVEKKAEGQKIDAFMMRTFGLKLKKQAWLCSKCSYLV